MTLTFGVPAALPQVYGDPAMLRQAILSLLTAMAEGVRGGAMAVDIVLRGDAVVWTIHRTGSGGVPNLSASDGVAISTSLIRVYGGRLWVDRDAPQGTAAIGIALPALKPKVVLAIDDDAGTVSLYHRYLQPYGYDLEAAGSGEEAWDILQRVEPDAILLDVLMPREDGWEVLQRLRAMPGTRETPILVCSVLSEPRLALALGADAVLQKPFDQEVLAQALSRLLCA